MEHFPNFQAQKLEAATPGTFCGFMNGGKLHLGFVVTNPDPNSRGANALVSISPGSPDCKNRPGMASAESFGNNKVIAFKDTRIQLHFDMDVGRPSDKIEDIAGAVILIDGGIGIAALSNAAKGQIFDLANGTVTGATENRHPYCRTWSVETRDSDGLWKTLCAFDFADTRANPPPQ